jgi:hypothetical protein
LPRPADDQQGLQFEEFNQFNVAAFLRRPASIGESPRYTMATRRSTTRLDPVAPFGGKRRFEVRLDLFNALNTVQFSGVNSTINFASWTDRTITNLPRLQRQAGEG